MGFAVAFLLAALLSAVPGWWLGTHLLRRGWNKWQIGLLIFPGIFLWCLSPTIMKAELPAWLENLAFGLNAFIVFGLLHAANVAFRKDLLGEELNSSLRWERTVRPKPEQPQSKLPLTEQKQILAETIRHGLELSPDEAKSFSVTVSLADHDPALRDPRAMARRDLMRLRLHADDYFARYASGFPNFHGQPWPGAKRRLESRLRRLK